MSLALRLCLGLAGMLAAAEESGTRLLRQPDLSRESIVFVYAGDLWKAARNGGTATRLTVTPEPEECPRFSPDGRTIAFTRGGDVYLIGSAGGEERRLTWHPAVDRVVDWAQDGAKLLLHSDRYRGNFTSHPHLFWLPSGGGLPEPLPIPRAAHGSLSPNGRRIAYGPNPEIVFWTPFKRYRGGSTGYIAVYDFQREHYEELPRTNANDIHPMWHEETIYFASDRDGTMNLYGYHLATKRTEQLTSYTEWEVKNPALGPGAIVYENAGWLYLLDLKSRRVGRICIRVPAAAPRSEDSMSWMTALDEVWSKYKERAFRPARIWESVKPRYQALMNWAAHGSDAEYVLREMLAEAGQSHIFLASQSKAPPANVGFLGADFIIDDGLYRFTKIYRGDESPGPLAGGGVNEGDYLLAVDNKPLRPPDNLCAAFSGKAGKPTTLTVNGSPAQAGARQVTVTPAANEVGLRYSEWVRCNRDRVAEASGGRLGYLHIQNVDPPGVDNFRRQWADLRNKVSAIIVDGRNNSGGRNPEGVLECLTRRPIRIMYDFRGRVPPFGCFFDGPKVMLANDQAASGGDELAYFFKAANAGPLIGTRTFGAMIGAGGTYKITGGWTLQIPEYAFWAPEKGEWYPENYGVQPDEQVELKPLPLTGGRDPQLERAIVLALETLKTYQKMPPPPPYKPAGAQQ